MLSLKPSLDSVLVGKQGAGCAEGAGLGMERARYGCKASCMKGEAFAAQVLRKPRVT